MYEYELYHHGIKGQKWGVRRFQSPNGTLTEEGKQRYLKGSKWGVRKSQNSDGSSTEKRKSRDVKDNKRSAESMVAKQIVKLNQRSAQDLQKDDAKRKQLMMFYMMNVNMENFMRPMLYYGY